MQVSRVLLTILCLEFCVIPGCSLMREDTVATYQTVEANPRRDTEQAVEQHAKAAEIIRRHLDGKRHHADLEIAEQHLQQALVADVTHAPSHNTLGILYLWQHKLYLAAWEFEYANKLVPWSYEPLHNLGMVYDTARRPERAVTFYEQAHQIAPTNAEVLGNLARARLQQGDSVEAVRPLLEKLVMIDHREDWLAWTAEVLGLNPIQLVSMKNKEEESPAADSPEADADDDNLPGAVPPVPPASAGAFLLQMPPLSGATAEYDFEMPADETEDSTDTASRVQDSR